MNPEIFPKSAPGSDFLAPKGHSMTPAQVERLKTWKRGKRTLLQRVWAGKTSPRTAIRFMCLDCVGEDKSAITQCGDRCCPLWKFRPYQHAQ